MSDTPTARPDADGRVTFVTNEEIEAALTDLPTAEAVAWVRTALDTRHTQVAGAYLRDLTPDRLAAERDALAARIDKALALHEVVTDDEGFEDCDSCHDEWPCPTVRALTEDVTP